MNNPPPSRIKTFNNFFLQWIALRWTFKTNKEGLSPMTFVCILSLGVGLGVLLSLLSIMFGLETSLRDNLLKNTPHILLQKNGGSELIPYNPTNNPIDQILEKNNIIERFYPFLSTEMILEHNDKISGVVVWGLANNEILKIQKDSKLLSSHETHDSSQKTSQLELAAPSAQQNKETKAPLVLIGSELASHLDLMLGDFIKLFTPLDRTGLFGLTPRGQVYTIGGLYKSGNYEFDKQYVFMELGKLQQLLNAPQKISGWHLWAHSLSDVDRLKKLLEKTLPHDIQIQSWKDLNSSLFKSLTLEQFSMSLTLGFAILISVLNLAMVMAMQISSRKINLGILKALGMTHVGIKKLFLWQALYILFLGFLLSAVLTTAILFWTHTFYEFPDIYYSRAIAYEIRPLPIIIILLVSILLTIVTTLYPSDRASKMNPITLLKEN